MIENEKEKTDETTTNQQDVEPQNAVQKAENVLSQITEQNARMEENIKQLQELKAHDMLSGKASGGQVPKSEEEKEIESARALLKGTGFENMEL
jgi:hypothetical protein